MGSVRKYTPGVIAEHVKELARKELCFWVVPPHDGKVRKYRCTVRRFAGAALGCLCVAGAFMFIAGDYLRVQIQRAKIHATVSSLVSERDTLKGTNVELQSSVSSLANDNQRVRSYEQELRQRLQELSWVLESAGALAPSAEKPAQAQASAQLRRPPGSNSRADGVGGAELDCSNNNPNPRCAGIRPLLGRGNQGLFQPMSLAIEGEAPASEPLGGDSIEQLDYLIGVLKTLPIALPGNGHINSGFGARISPFTSRLSMHEGIDFALSTGSGVHATGDGYIRAVERTPTYGLVVDIAHTDRIVTRYAHLSKVFVKEGERICRGEIIGLVGSSGRSTGPHLHYEIRVDGVPRNPKPFLELASRLQDFLGAQDANT